MAQFKVLDVDIETAAGRSTDSLPYTGNFEGISEISGHKYAYYY